MEEEVSTDFAWLLYMPAELRRDILHKAAFKVTN